jgi:hypothetical protein
MSSSAPPVAAPVSGLYPTINDQEALVAVPVTSSVEPTGQDGTTAAPVAGANCWHTMESLLVHASENNASAFFLL